MIPSAARNAIADAFWSLLEQKDVDSVTVSDIAKARSITRQAFYYHFPSIADMIAYAIQRYVSDLTDRILPIHDPKEALALAFSPAADHADIILRLIRSKKYPVYPIISDAVMDNVAHVLLERRITRDLGFDAAEIAVRFYSGALLHVLFGACRQVTDLTQASRELVPSV